MKLTNDIRSVLFGVAVGDALGVPVEFKSRDYLDANPVTDMFGFGTYNQLPGTFSDDSSLTFCLAEALTKGFDLNEIAENCMAWAYDGYWAARGQVFDIGMATENAMERLRRGVRPEVAGGMSVSSNGNGSLMRIAPLLFYIKDKPVEERYELTKLVSSITHGHIRSVIACFYYLEFAKQLLDKKDKKSIYKHLQTLVPEHLNQLEINPEEIALFSRLFNEDISLLPVDEIRSSGYVLHTLEASIWCLLTTDNYSDAVLKAINLGEDTDTTGAVTGGLAALLYGVENIPENWKEQLARHDDIEELAERLVLKINH
ncbi:ADP-ribosyl-[dinitrogen reductase] glycohydrolase [compost metagenome]